MKIKVFEIVKSGLSPLSVEMETVIQDWLNDNDQIKAEKKVDDMCKKLLANLIIEDYKVNKI